MNPLLRGTRLNPFKEARVGEELETEGVEVEEEEAELEINN